MGYSSPQHRKIDMTEVKAETNIGQFSVAVTADLDVTGDVLVNLAELGLLNMFSSIRATLEKTMWGGGSRPEKWSSDVTAYSAEMAKAMQVAGSVKFDELSKEKKLPSVLFEVTGQYISTAMKAVHVSATNTLATLKGQPPEIINAFGIAFGGLLASDTEEEKLAKLVTHFAKVQKG